MSNVNRKVSFYRLSLEKETLILERRTTRVDILSNSKIEEYFQKIYNEKMASLSNGSKAIIVEVTNNKYVIETIEFNDHRAFIKIGQQNAANTVALRDKSTLESESVPMRETQLLELFTFCLIDFETGIISYIGINGAPRISAIRGLFDSTLHDDNIHATLAAIMTNDILERLVKKNIISKISLTVAVPNDEVLSDCMGLDMESFDSLRNIKTRTATYKIVAARNKNMFENSHKLAELIASIKTKYGDRLKGMSANAKDFHEKSQTYDLLQYNFTKTVTLGGHDSTLIQMDDFKDALRHTYEQYKDELVRYCR